MEKYDVSVVIPVYNCEKYVKKCVKSIANQDYEKLDRVQVILVDDGSIDRSLEVCEKLKKENKNFTIDIITGENEGVSAARNKGIELAKGRYIMFIDADDFISKNAIRLLVDFFDKHYDEIDGVVYPRYEYNVENGKKQILKRYLDMERTQIYDLEKDFWAIQPTLNIIVKNLYENNILFDTKVYFHEDILYNTEILMKKLKVGYLKEAKYYYRIYGNSTTDSKETPLYSYEQFMYVAETLFDKYKDENGRVYQYVQRIILNVIRYRILKDKLFPYHLEGEEWSKAYTRLINIIKQIDDENIIQYKQMDKYHKMYLIDLKNEKIVVNSSYNGSFLISNQEHILFSESSIEIVVNRFRLKNEKIYILGFLKSTVFKYKIPELYIKIVKQNGEIIKKEIKLKDTIADRYKTNMKVAKFCGFEYELNVEEIERFSLNVYIDNIKANVYYYFNIWTPFNKKVNSFKIYSGNRRIQFKQNIFYVSKPKKKTRRKDFWRAIKRYNNIDYKINIYRVLALLMRKYKSKIWLYYDRSNVIDNGYYQYVHDVKIKDNIKKYYVADGDMSIYRKKFNRKEMKNVIKFGSFKHKILFLNSDKILTSFASMQEYSPFYKNYQYYKDILNYDIIYLQHGILHAKLLKMYSKDFAKIDKIVISSNFEKNNLINNYGYSENDILEVGMPRMDENREVIEPENKIIFAPSWREYLIGKSVNRRREINIDKFIKSKYYIEIMKFLQDERLLSKLKEKNMILDFKLHPIFEPYKQCFAEIENDNIIVSIGNTDLNKYKAFITDFSSFQFDFVKLKRPIIYFVPDMKEFKAGLHSYRELDLKYEDAFGKLCLNGNDLVDEIIKLIDNNFKMKPIYEKRMEEFFIDVKNGKDKLYEILKTD